MTRRPKPLSDEQLSRILGEHDAGQLCRTGAADWVGENTGGYIFVWPIGRAGQAALNEPENGSSRITEAFAKLFDYGYEPLGSPEQLLDLLKDARL